MTLPNKYPANLQYSKFGGSRWEQTLARSLQTICRHLAPPPPIYVVRPEPGLASWQTPIDDRYDSFSHHFFLATIIFPHTYIVKPHEPLDSATL